jgi:polysaccharide biosynthesis/export protein
MDEKKAIEVPLEGRSRITITIDIQGQEKKAQQTEPTPPSEKNLPKLIAPETSDRVFVDVTAYNSKKYYVHGDVTAPGSLPCTGKDTVMDALIYAAGLLPTAEPNDIRLVRPARGGKPARVYKVDLEAIQDKGDVTFNYQLFPDDRLIVGRKQVVKTTIELDRLAGSLHTVLSAIQSDVNVLRAIDALSPEQRNKLMREYVDFWAKRLSRPGGVKLDEKTLREALIRRLQIKPEKPAGKK